MSTVRLVTRGAVAAVLTLLPLSAFAVPAYADSTAPPVVSTAWFWNEKTLSAQGQTVPTLPDQANAASGVPDGSLGVGYLTDQLASNDKSTAIGFDLTTIPLNATFTTFSLTTPLDPAAKQVQGQTADISACENIDVFTDAAGPQDISKAPPYATPTCVKGVFDSAKKAYTFDLTAIANDWSVGTPADGIAIVPTILDTTSQRPFSIALADKNAMTTKASWTPPVAEPVAPAAPPVVQPVQQAPEPVVPAVAPAPDLGIPLGSVVQPAAPAQGPAVSVPLEPAPVANSAPVRAAIDAVAYSQTLRPSNGLWLGLAGLLLLLALAWVIQSDPMAPQPLDERRQRFARAVSARTS